MRIALANVIGLNVPVSNLHSWVSGIQPDASWVPKIILLKINFLTFCGPEIGTGKRDTFALPHIEMSPEMIPENGTDSVPYFQASF